MKSLTYWENPSSNSLHKACTGFPVVPVALKAVLKAACDSENCYVSRPRMHTGENRPVRNREIWNRNLMRLSENLSN